MSGFHHSLHRRPVLRSSHSRHHPRPGPKRRSSSRSSSSSHRRSRRSRVDIRIRNRRGGRRSQVSSSLSRGSTVDRCLRTLSTINRSSSLTGSRRRGAIDRSGRRGALSTIPSRSRSTRILLHSFLQFAYTPKTHQQVYNPLMNKKSKHTSNSPLLRTSIRRKQNHARNKDGELHLV